MAKNAATQDFVPIEHIRDGIAVLKNGELRAILITSSLNLSLKSEDEQQAIILQFQNLLNSLDFPVQIFIQSRRLNIDPYLNILQERSTQVEEDLLKIQIHEYMGFIKKFTDEVNIMTKHFFIVVPYMPTLLQGKNQANKFLAIGGIGKQTGSEINNDDFEAARIQLEQRVSNLIQGLTRFGVRAQRLNSEEVIELFYKLFNPAEQNRSAPKVEEEQIKK